jgi:hypothetical protein
MLQMSYLHIYITSWLLPATAKVPLANASRMEHLNYFISNNLEEWFSGLRQQVPTKFIFLQYNVDAGFMRSIYPIFFILIIYAAWFVILKVA